MQFDCKSWLTTELPHYGHVFTKTSYTFSSSQLLFAPVRFISFPEQDLTLKFFHAFKLLQLLID